MMFIGIERIIEELMHYELSSSFKNCVAKYLNQEQQSIEKLAVSAQYQVGKKARTRNTGDFEHGPRWKTVGVRFNDERQQIAIVLSFEGHSESRNNHPQTFQIWIVFSEFRNGFLEMVIKQATIRSNEILNGFSRSLTRIKHKSYEPAFNSSLKVHRISDSNINGFHWVLVESIEFGSFTIMEFCDFELVDIHVFYSKMQATDSYKERCSIVNQ